MVLLLVQSPIPPPTAGAVEYWLLALMAGAIAAIWWRLNDSQEKRITRAEKGQDALLAENQTSQQTLRDMIEAVKQAASIADAAVGAAKLAYETSQRNGEKLDDSAALIQATNDDLHALWDRLDIPPSTPPRRRAP